MTCPDNFSLQIEEDQGYHCIGCIGDSQQNLGQPHEFAAIITNFK